MTDKPNPNVNDELTKNVTGYLHSLLESGRVNVTTDQAEYIVKCKEWLRKVNNDELLVSPAPPYKEE